MKTNKHDLFDPLIKNISELYIQNNKQRSFSIVQSCITGLIVLGKDCKHSIDLAQQSRQHQSEQIKQLTNQLEQANERIRK